MSGIRAKGLGFLDLGFKFLRPRAFRTYGLGYRMGLTV